MAHPPQGSQRTVVDPGLLEDYDQLGDNPTSTRQVLLERGHGAIRSRRKRVG